MTCSDQGTMALPIGTRNNNAVIREIAPPAKLNGNHFLIATEVIQILYTPSLDSLIVTSFNM